MPTDRAQDTEAIRAALDASSLIADCGEHPDLVDAENAARKAAPALDRLVARLEAAEQALRSARVFASQVLYCDTYGCENGPAHCLHATAQRQLDALAAAAPGETTEPQ